MDAKQFAADLLVLIYEEADEVFNNQALRVRTYRELGMLTNDAGFVVTMKDGSEFQVTIVQSRQARG